MYEKRYHDSIGNIIWIWYIFISWHSFWINPNQCMFFKTAGVSDLYKMKDVVTISEEHCGRMVQLNYQWWPQTMYSSGIILWRKRKTDSFFHCNKIIWYLNYRFFFSFFYRKFLQCQIFRTASKWIVHGNNSMPDSQCPRRK